MGSIDGPSSGDGDADQTDMEVQQLQAANQRLESQITSLKDELSREMELNNTLKNDAAHQKQVSMLSGAVSIVAAALAGYVIFLRHQANRRY